MKYLPIAVSLTLAALPLTAGAEIVKWVDDKGQVHYSDHAPAKAKKAKTMNLPSSPSTTTAPAASKSTAEKERDFQQRGADKEAADKKAADDQKQAAEAKRNCDAARSNLQALDSGRVATYNAKGEKSFMDDAQRAQAKEQAQKDIKQWCK